MNFFYEQKIKWTDSVFIFCVFVRMDLHFCIKIWQKTVLKYKHSTKINKFVGAYVRYVYTLTANAFSFAFFLKVPQQSFLFFIPFCFCSNNKGSKRLQYVPYFKEPYNIIYAFNFLYFHTNFMKRRDIERMLVFSIYNSLFVWSNTQWSSYVCTYVQTYTYFWSIKRYMMY